PVEIGVWSVSPKTVRIAVRPVVSGSPVPVPATGALAQEEFGAARVRADDAPALSRVQAGDVIVSFTDGPPTIHVRTAEGRQVQELALDAANPGMSFLLGNGPLLGF